VVSLISLRNLLFWFDDDDDDILHKLC
jgi:hypothetical protein